MSLIDVPEEVRVKVVSVALCHALVMEQVRAQQEDARILLAGKLLKRVDDYLLGTTEYGRKERKIAVAMLEGELKDSFDELRKRAAECTSTLTDWHSSDWTVAQTFMGITTSYKHEHDGSIWVKLNGTMEGVQVIDQLATVREVDLYRYWIPFCDKSSLLKRIGIVEVLAYFNTAVPGVHRDCVLHAYGCDAVLEERCILIQGKSVDKWDGVEFPKSGGWRHGRLDVRAFRAKIEVLSPTSASTSIVANIDPKTPLPKALVNFTLRKVAGMLLYCLQQTARRISTDQDSRHRRRILEDDEFYARWLYPRIERFYRKMGWAIDDDLVREGHSARQEDHPIDLQGSKTAVASGACCTPQSRRGNGIKVAFGRLLKRKRVTRKPTETAQPQVGLDIEPRLVEKWQTKRDNNQSSDPKPASSSLRLVIYILFAACTVLATQLCQALGRRAYQSRRWLCALLFSFFVYVSMAHA